MTIDEHHRSEAAALAARSDEVTFAPDPDRWRRLLHQLTRGMLGRHRRWRTPTRTAAPWQDVPSFEREGWRERIAALGDDDVFAVEYRVCRRCRLAWVEIPYTDPRYRRAGLATAGLAALRVEHPGVSWRTLGRHGHDSREFWNRLGENVPGGYQPRKRCEHVAN